MIHLNILLFGTVFLSTAFAWPTWQAGANNVQWAEYCDFSGHDLYSKPSTGAQCGNLCAADAACTYFTWTQYNSGTCWMKSGSNLQPIYYTSGYSVCGYVQNKSGGGSQPFPGHFTYYNDAGYGACGTPIDASSEMLVAVAYGYWTSPNPNNDPLCGQCLKVEYNGKSITVPIKDKCPSCANDHMDLSLPAFRQLADPNIGDVYGATFQFVSC